MAERQYRLSEAQVNELIAAYAQANDGPTRTRLLAVRLYGTGYPVAQISEITPCSRTSLMAWCQKYLAQGPAALADHRAGGNSRKLTSEQLADLCQRLHQHTPHAVFGAEAATAEGQFLDRGGPAASHPALVWRALPESHLLLDALCPLRLQLPTAGPGVQVPARSGHRHVRRDG